VYHLRGTAATGSMRRNSLPKSKWDIPGSRRNLHAALVQSVVGSRDTPAAKYVNSLFTKSCLIIRREWVSSAHCLDMFIPDLSTPRTLIRFDGTKEQVKNT
jgi:hypothetical protein